MADRFEAFIFGGRWVITPVYAGLMVALVLYMLKFLQELFETCIELPHLTEAELMVRVLNLVDISMVGNLILMIMIGGYSIFVRKMDVANAKERPQWLDKIDSGTLKVKMGMSLVGVSSIYLLKSFVEAQNVSADTLWKQVLIHLVFIVSTITLAWTCKVTHDAVGHSKQDHQEDEAHH